MTQQITKQQWEDATSTYVIVMIWEPKKGSKKSTPTVRAVGDFPTYSKARTAMKKLLRDATAEHAPERRTLYVARKFDISKLDLFDSYVIAETDVN